MTSEKYIKIWTTGDQDCDAFLLKCADVVLTQPNKEKHRIFEGEFRNTQNNSVTKAACVVQKEKNGVSVRKLDP